MKTPDLPSAVAPVPAAEIRPDSSPVTITELAQLPFFEGLSQVHLEELRPHTKVSRFKAGERLLAQGELANRFYVIVSGRVAIECDINGETVVVQEIGPGETAGFSWSFTPERLHFTARALEPVKAVFFYGTLLQEDCELDPTLGYEIAIRTGRVLMGRMESLIEVLRKRLPQTDRATVFWGL
jgi:CRP/FNR family transcriptional regulator, cyclic AMP receptor protein